IGKSALAREARARAEARSLRVVSSSPLEPEARLSYSGLADLLGETFAEELTDLPAPQRHALEVALLRQEPEGPAPNELAVSLAVIGAIRSLVSREPILLVVDGAQWLDPPSASALGYAARRLDTEPAGVLVSRRAETEDGGLRLDRIVAPERLRRISL